MSAKERELELLQQIRKQWRESEWKLNFLRTIAGTPQSEPSNQELLEWNRTN